MCSRVNISFQVVQYLFDCLVVWYGMLTMPGIFNVSSQNHVQEHFHPPRLRHYLTTTSDVHALRYANGSGR
jgi:hypothetical protein